MHPWTASEYFLRLVRRDAASYDLSLKIHEGLKVEGSIGKITKGVILHRQSVPPEREVDKLNLYSTLKVEQKVARASGRIRCAWRCGRSAIS